MSPMPTATAVNTDRHLKRKQTVFILLFPLIFCYYEILFKISTSGNIISLGTFFTLIFTVALGAVLYLICSISKNEKLNHGFATAFLFIGAFIFLVEYFVYREFKIFYDINTVTGGAGHVVGDFMDEIKSLLFCFNGISKILLFLLPVIIYGFFGLRPAPQSNARKRIFVIILAAILFFSNTMLISVSTLGAKYSQEYTFQDAVSNFGLTTALRLDIARSVLGMKPDNGFDVDDPEESELIETEEPVETKVITGDNKMDIDFDALVEGASERLVNIDKYVASLKPSNKNQYTGLFEGKNLIMISAEAFCAEVIDKDLTPTLYRLATKGINFTDYYQPASAGTTGGEYENLLGLLPSDGGMSFKNSAGHNLYFSMGNQLNRLGYYGKSFHNNTYTYYDRHLTHPWLGYSDGFMGYGNGMEQYVTNQWPQSDLEMMQGTLPTYIDRQPFNVYYMSVSGHGNYTRTGNSMTVKNWDAVKDLDYSDPVKGYLAANIELDKALEYTVKALEEKGIADDTVICVAADHFPYSLDNDAYLGNMPYLSELYGYDVLNYIQRDHNRLIIWCGCLEDEPPIVVSSPTFSLDIVPTLSNLFGTEFDSRLLPGRDVFSNAEAIIFNTGYDWKTDLGTYISAKGKFIPTDSNAVIPDGYVDRIRSIVANKIKYCGGVLDTDYYAHIFGKVS